MTEHRRERNELYRTLFMAIDEGLCVIEMLFDAQGKPADYRFLETNPAFENHTGLHDAVGKTARELVPDLDAQWFETYGKVALTGQPVRFIDEAKAMEGRWFDVYAFRLGGSDSRRVAILFKNITEQKQTEIALRESEERLRRAVAATRTVVWEWDVANDRITTTENIAQVYGISAIDFAAQGWALVAAEDQVRHLAVVQRVAEKGGEYHAEFRIIHPDTGATVWIEERAAAIADDEGRVVRLVGVSADVTERKRLERAQQDFVAMAGHDLATPVTVLRARAQLMQRRQAYDEEAIRAIIEQTARMERLLSDLRELAQLETGQVDLRLTSVALGNLAREAAERVQVQATTHAVRVETPETPICGEWDRDRLGQVLDNLLSNAVKYSRPGGEIVVRVEPNGSEAWVRVVDEGEGIPPETLPRLFERYYRADRSDTKVGLGLGLYIARMLVEAHGGRIWAESTPGQGSTFTIALPVP
ncbi:MAG: PAS domain S-box protein [Chloroflexia bacterium]|nr:PAS domain S-box protein [Chloroflexia bacterium]